MSTGNTKPQLLVRSQLPEFVANDYPKFVEFLKAYYTFVNNNYNVNVEDLRDADNTSSALLVFLRRELMKNFPTAVINERKLINTIRELYNRKGNLDSIKLLFKLFFNDSVIIYQPGNRILKASDGKWFQYNMVVLSQIDWDKLSADMIRAAVGIAPYTTLFNTVINTVKIGEVTSCSSTQFVCTSTSQLSVGEPVKFTGDVFGGVVAGATYYVSNVTGLRTFEISNTLGGSIRPLAPSSGLMNLNLTTGGYKVGDINQSGTITSADALLVRKFSLFSKNIEINNQQRSHIEDILIPTLQTNPAFSEYVFSNLNLNNIVPNVSRLIIENKFGRFTPTVEKIEVEANKKIRLFYKTYTNLKVETGQLVEVTGENGNVVFTGKHAQSQSNLRIIDPGSNWQKGQVITIQGSVKDTIARVLEVGPQGQLLRVEILEYGFSHDENQSVIISPYPVKPSSNSAFDVDTTITGVNPSPGVPYSYTHVITLDDYTEGITEKLYGEKNPISYNVLADEILNAANDQVNAAALFNQVYADTEGDSYKLGDVNRSGGPILSLSTISGTMASGPAPYEYDNIVPLNVTGVGSGAIVKVIVNTVGSGYSGNITVEIKNPGTAYHIGKQIRIPGNQLGGATPTNDLTITIGNVDSVTQTDYRAVSTWITNPNNVSIASKTHIETFLVPKLKELTDTVDPLNLPNPDYTSILFKIINPFAPVLSSSTSESSSVKYNFSELTFEEWVTSRAILAFENSDIIKTKGYYLNDESIISNNESRLQDNYFFQLYSYMIETTKDADEVSNILNQFHPAGMKYFFQKNKKSFFSIRDIIESYRAISNDVVFARDVTSNTDVVVKTVGIDIPRILVDAEGFALVDEFGNPLYSEEDFVEDFIEALAKTLIKPIFDSEISVSDAWGPEQDPIKFVFKPIFETATPSTAPVKFFTKNKEGERGDVFVAATTATPKTSQKIAVPDQFLPADIDPIKLFTKRSITGVNEPTDENIKFFTKRSITGVNEPTDENIKFFTKRSTDTSTPADSAPIRQVSKEAVAESVLPSDSARRNMTKYTELSTASLNDGSLVSVIEKGYAQDDYYVLNQGANNYYVIAITATIE